MLMFGMRLGADPRTVVTTTPRLAKLIRDLVRDSICVVTRGSSYENRAKLAPAFFDQIIRKYEGTRLGRHSTPSCSKTRPARCGRTVRSRRADCAQHRR
jgi:phage terminase large subunit-like protein